MAIVFMDGFDHYAPGQEGRKWDVDNFAATGTSNPRTGTGHATMNTTTEYFGKLMTPTLGSVVVGMAAHISSGFTSDTYDSILQFYTSSGSFQCSLQYGQTEKRFRFFNNDLGTSTASANTFDLSTGYHHIEVKLTFDNGTPANNTVELRINEVAEIGGALGVENFDTNPRATDNIDEVRLNGITTATVIDVDDFYILNSTSPNNDFLGDVKISTLYVNADGGLTAWTGDYTDVDDATPDDNTTNITSSTNGQQSLFDVDTLSGMATPVKGIQISSATRKDGGGDGDIKILTSPDSGSTLYKSSTITVGAAASLHPYLMQQQDVDPKTAAAWTVANINAAEFGVEQVS
jgi:hypothetical protein